MTGRIAGPTVTEWQRRWAPVWWRTTETNSPTAVCHSPDHDEGGWVRSWTLWRCTPEGDTQIANGLAFGWQHVTDAHAYAAQLWDRHGWAGYWLCRRCKASHAPLADVGVNQDHARICHCGGELGWVDTYSLEVAVYARHA